MLAEGYSRQAVLTADGCYQTVGEIPDDTANCCPIDICNISAGGVMCSFVALLPNGPLWDRAKEERIARYYPGPCELEPLCFPGVCSSVVDYAIYSGYRLYYLMRGPLWSALRESSPYSAVETIDSYLSLFGWSNWWETVCRDPRLGPSPLDCSVLTPDITLCAANFQPVYIPTIPAALSSALDRAIAISLYRLQMQPIKNICGINWVIEPLGCELRPPVAGGLDPCGNMTWEICNTKNTIDSAVGLSCNQQDPYQVQAYFTINSLEFHPETGICSPTGSELINIWPAMLAAQSIALSMIPGQFCDTPIRRCAGA